MKTLTRNSLPNQPLNQALVIIIGLISLALTGCATPPPETAIRQPLYMRPEAVAVAPVNNGAIFQPGANQSRPGISLFEDRKARYVGDILTVKLVENTVAKRNSASNSERSANTSINVPSPKILGATRGIGASSWAAGSDSSREVSSDDSNSNSVSGSITVTVVEVLPNGNLVVAGEKQLTVNSDTEYIRLAGIVNPHQISSANSINSTQLANAQFESKNSQSVDKSQVGSMLARFFLAILPF